MRLALKVIDRDRFTERFVIQRWENILFGGQVNCGKYTRVGYY